MSLLSSITRLVKDPPPSYVFEFSEEGLAYSHDGKNGFEPLPSGDAAGGSHRRQRAARGRRLRGDRTRRACPTDRSGEPRRSCFPTLTVRVSVLDFDSFPDAADEQISLVRFRVKKTIPFDVESASVSYYHAAGGQFEWEEGSGGGNRVAGGSGAL